MSLILDALRKSEAERRRGEAPGLHALAPPAPGQARRAWRQWPIVAGGALVLVAVAILLWPRAPDVAAPHAPATTYAEVADATAADATRSAARATDVPVADESFAASTPTTEAAVAATPPPRPDPVPVTPAHPPPPRASPADVVARRPERVAPTDAAPALAPVASPDAAAAATEEALPPLAVLAPGERAALPALKLSMHVWNEEPARRFAIVDGQRLTEGARIGAAVVARIRRDGVELDVNGRRLLLPRP